MSRSAVADALVLQFIKAVVRGMEEDPGHSDLDNEQPITVRMTLGDYRLAKRLMYMLEDKP